MLFERKIPAYLIDSENVGSTWVDLLQTDEKFDLYICVTENAKSLNFTLLKELTGDTRHKINIIECQPGKNSLDFYLSSYIGYLIGKGKHSAYVVVSQDTGYDHVIEYWCSQGYDVKRINTKPEIQKKQTRKTPVRKQKTEVKKAQPQAPINSETRVIVKDESKVAKPSQTPKQRKKPQPVDPPKEEKAVKKRASKKKTNVDQNEAKVFLESLLKDYPSEEIEQIKAALDKVPAEKRTDKNYIYRGLIRRFKSEKGLAIYSLLKKDLDKYYAKNS